MLQKKANSGAWFFPVFIVACAMVFILGVGEALAQNPIRIIAPNGKICPDFPGLTERFARCISGTLAWSMEQYTSTFISFFVFTVNALMALAVVIFGFYLYTGKAKPALNEAVMLAIKIGIIVFLINAGNYKEVFNLMVDAINWMVGLVTNYTAGQYSAHCGNSTYIWARVDCALNMIIGGILPGTTIVSGFSGFVLALLFSKEIGIALFFFGVGIILSTVLALFQALFTLISAYIALALLSLMAPLVIPLVLFRVTKPYFDKWLRLTIGVMLQPVFLFAFLALFLMALEISIFSGPYSVYRSIACGQVDAPNFKIGEFAMQHGQIQQRAGNTSIFSMLVSQDSRNFTGGAFGAEAVPEGILGDQANREAGRDGIVLFSSDAAVIDIRTDAVNLEHMAHLCGRMDPVQYVTRLIMSLFAAAAVIYIFYTMLHTIPYLGTLVSGDLFSIPNLSKIIPMDSLAGNKLMTNLGMGRHTGGS